MAYASSKESFSIYGGRFRKNTPNNGQEKDCSHSNRYIVRLHACFHYFGKFSNFDMCVINLGFVFVNWSADLVTWWISGSCRSYQHTKYHKRKSTDLIWKEWIGAVSSLFIVWLGEDHFVFFCVLDICCTVVLYYFIWSEIEYWILSILPSGIIPWVWERYHCDFAETKNQWARDDPAFVVICCLLLAVSAAAFCAAWVAFPFGWSSMFYFYLDKSVVLKCALPRSVSTKLWEIKSDVIGYEPEHLWFLILVLTDMVEV